MLISVGCQTSEPQKTQNDVTNTNDQIEIKKTISANEKDIDTSFTVTTPKPVLKKKKTIIKPIEAADPIDVDFIRDPFDDPNYIGTPCDDVNGRCTRHNHHNDQNWENNYPNEIVDSLNK